MSHVPTVATEARRQVVKAKRVLLNDEELKIKKERLRLEQDELAFRRRVLDHQYEQYFGEASMNTLMQACTVMQEMAISCQDMNQIEESLQIETKPVCHLNRRVKVWWKGDNRFYKGKILKTGVLVKYDDGDLQWETSYESDDNLEETNVWQCQRSNGCPKAAGHVGRCSVTGRVLSSTNKRSFSKPFEMYKSTRPRTEP